ncbi:MAG: hypothetical protein A3F83_01120 [Candidatus Glassbacteria bacterium RIFCSPLOWO2_12_FULL_58_11]|uniref:SbsA Ig-like domain-containing protein n=1 Tax=Candidatus Glassbacteria bacterium RIFCSPLOWO2_12_FULL_58_11 TaxID=1817867 RepID=A0A1F5YTH8_9BACT|nr:MAG: hypothetical protein A3F83_01120 [Candidatus Glassbacteria bacterium RIFCSPLOWO2_12_FULL_58_11]
MRKVSLYRMALTLAVLCFAPLLPALAEINQKVTASGNNVGMIISADGNTLTLGGKHQFPAGSGNSVSAARWTYAVNCVRDLNGDGSQEDTTIIQSQGAWVRGYTATPEARDLLKTEYESGIEMKLGAGKPSLSQVWSSLDKDDLDSWPVQFREGRSASGAPIIKGAQTLAAFSSDVWIPANFGSGVSFENQFYFLNFSISSNMVFAHSRIQNMSEYLKWNRDISYLVEKTPDGQTWRQWQLMYISRSFQFGSENFRSTGWALHPGKLIQVQLDIDGTNAGFSGGNTPFVAHKLLKPPSHGGKQMDLTNIQVREVGATTYGFSPPPDLIASGRPKGPTWRFGIGEIGTLYSNQVNPFTDQIATGWPGDLRGTRFEDRWVFGQHGGDIYAFYGILDEFAPRDTTSIDYVIAFVEPASPPAILPPNEISSIDDPGFQAQLAPVEDYISAAEVILSSGYSLPVPPVAPPLTIIPGDRQVTITWSDINLSESDPYYAFLRENSELDPEGNYREKDFEGYRLYRSFVGPNDSHSELVWQSSLSTDDLKFSFNDRIDNDERQRMRNGLRVWYALVPFDRNYDPATGAEFSLPEPGVSKIWYGSPQNGLYTVIPRSDASNYRPATPQVRFNPASETVTPLPFLTVTLRGNGTGAFLDDPKYLEPPAEINVNVVIEGKITQDLDLNLRVLDMLPHGEHGASRVVALLGAQGEKVDGEREFPVKTKDPSPDKVEYLWNGPVDADGQLYTVNSTLMNFGFYRGDLYTFINPGSYSGATVEALVLDRGGSWDFNAGQPWYQGLSRCGVFEVTWKDTGNGALTLEVFDRVHGINVPFSPYIDDNGWGFLPPGASDYTVFYEEFGLYSESEGDNEEPSQSERSALLTQTIPSGNTLQFGLWLDGQAIHFSREGGITMPSAGTLFTITSAFGAWNDDQTEFTQYADPPFLGDNWNIHISASSLKAGDADLSKISVVPNPYLASSFLDIGPASRRIDFVNLPDRCTIRIYSLGGVLVNVLNHIGANRSGWGNYIDWDELDLESQPKQYTGWDNHGGTEPWNLRNRFGQMVASGLYFYHVTDSRGKSSTGKFYIVN